MADDTIGNLLGPRKTFVYQSDSSVSYNITLDSSVSTALGNDASTNGALPVLRATAARPLRPRYVLMQLKSDPKVRKKAIICDLVNSNFLSSAALDVTINNVVWTIVGRVGEKRSALTVDDATP